MMQKCAKFACADTLRESCVRASYFDEALIDHRSLQHPVKAYYLSNIITFTLILPLLTEFDAHETRAIV